MNSNHSRLAIYVPELIVGGAERSMLKLAGGISRRGNEVDLVLAHAGGPLMDEVPASVRVVDLGAGRVLTSLPALARYLRRERPAALLSVLQANLIAPWARSLAGVSTRIFVSERNTLSSEIRHYASSLRMRLMPRMIRLSYPRADGIVAVSEGVATDLAKATGIPRRRIQVIYNPIVTPRLEEMSRESLTNPWFEPGAPPVILAVGRLTVQKDFGTLIRAFSSVRRSHVAHLMILGDGEERAALQSQIQDAGLERDVSMPGYIPNPYPYMKRSSLFVLSSRWEGLPGVLIEALYCGVPAVATDCPSGSREILADGKFGPLVPVGDAKALAEAISGHLEKPLPPPPSESWKPYTEDTVVGQYLELLHRRSSN
jgi:glycosyltransferase involved in cell wall biosynthesis